MADEQPIIVIKKVSGHGGHHGGAWKVAYADFVTAMMALFIVLWLLSSTNKQTQEEIAGYFNDPKGTASKKGSEGKPQPKEQSKEKKDDMAALKADLMKAIDSINMLNKLKKQIEISITEEGLRIELIEDEKGTFFQSGSAQPTPALEELLKVLSEQLKNLPNNISIEGHTDAQPYSSKGPYGNWELSTDRANVARRSMQNDGVRLNQVSQVRGFADQRLHTPDKPFDASNRRISLVVQNLPVREKPKEIAKEGGKETPKEGGKEAPKEGSKDAPKESAKADGTSSKPEAGTAPEEKAKAESGAPAAEKPSISLMARAKGLFTRTKAPAPSPAPEGNRSE
ncbi:flagellar motor protein MotB [Granulicella sibirica]|uniref:Flagellar motor rotation protein MotB n=1 Tax=Granulicella sibirica TaxID=2479048 RepID=A0A4Q0T0Z3_9BACT|nr:flagellar motor protein MotB [Granulicella sibirica]RXH57283.1 Flagellar motor rotation protein MotB [Granulicella sibirica]